MLALGNLSNDWSYIQIISKNMKTRKRNKRTSSQDAPKNTTETSDQSTRVDFIDVMDTWCDGATKKKILSQYTFYREKRGLFSTDAASSFSQDFDDPVSWWSNFGCEVPELQSFAIKALSQSTSASPCETNWSLYKSNRY